MLHYSHNALNQFARHMRKFSTPAEEHLWYFLKAKRFKGFKFYRQRVLGRYIVDFYCHQKRLIVEADGSGHFTEEQSVYDAMRTQWLEASNYRVLRFTNAEITEKTQHVLDEIYRALHSG
jgi:very-short-patch-repair endonuclease